MQEDSQNTKKDPIQENHTEEQDNIQSLIEIIKEYEISLNI